MHQAGPVSAVQALVRKAADGQQAVMMCSVSTASAHLLLAAAMFMYTVSARLMLAAQLANMAAVSAHQILAATFAWMCDMHAGFTTPAHLDPTSFCYMSATQLCSYTTC